MKKIKDFQDLLHNKHIDRILFLVFPVLIFYFTQTAIGSEGIKDIEPQLLLLNILIFEAFAFFFLGLTARMKAAIIAEEIIFGVFAVANSYVRMFRGSYIMPWDFVALRTAVNVAGNYDYAMDINARNALIGLVAVFIAAVLLFTDEKPELKLPKRLACVLLSAVFILALGAVVSNEDTAEELRLHDSRFSVTKAYTSNGMMLGFIYKLQKIFVEKPEGYSKEKEMLILDDINVAEEPDTEELPDIIVVMNEAFSDLKVDCDFNTNKDYMPFVHSLKGAENTITGYAHVSVLGGQTPNSEFELLTGNTMAFLPENSIPFQTFVRKRMDAIPWHLQDFGYFNLAMHPYHSSGWDRTIAWPLLGFQECRFLTDFNKYDPELKKVRNYISDEAMYDVLLDKMSKRDDPEQPIFAFNVTMQNHSGYGKDYDNLPHEISVEGAESAAGENSGSLINYLNLIYESDKAFEKLITRLKDADRPTIVLFYGDHQPDPEDAEPIFSMNGIDVNNLPPEYVVKDHMVPFVIWANYDIKDESNVDISLNYLGNRLLKEAGIPLTRYRTYIETFSEEYPVISSIGGKRKDGSVIGLKELREELNALSSMQYYEMFEDTDNYE